MGWKLAGPPFLCQLFFKTSTGMGFSENYPVDKPSYDEVLTAVTTPDTGLIDLRRKLFAAPAMIEYVRVSDTTKKRDTVVQYYVQAGGEGKYVPTQGDTCPDDDALLFRSQGVDGTTPVFNLRPLRLIPEECATSRRVILPVGWQTALDAFSTWLKTNSKVMIRSGGTWKAVSLTSTTYAPELSRRKVGRPFGLSRGRSLRP